MGQFAAYVLPGSVFVAFGLKWSLDATTEPKPLMVEDQCLECVAEDTRSSSRGSRGLHASARRRKCCHYKNIPCEAFAKLTVTGIGVAASLAAAYHGGEVKFVGDILYATVYLFFALSGLVDVLVFYCPYTMPMGLEKFALSLAFFMEGLIFKLHLSQRAFMEQHIHTLLICAIFGCAFTCLIEIVLPRSRLARFCRAFCTLVHGSWDIQSGFILYSSNSVPPVWNSSDDFDSALVWITLTFAWHCAGAIVILLILMALSRKRVIVPPPHIEAYETERSSHSLQIPHCRFSSLSNYGDLNKP